MRKYGAEEPIQSVDDTAVPEKPVAPPETSEDVSDVRDAVVTEDER